MSLPARLFLLVPAADAIFITTLILGTGSQPLDTFSVVLTIYNLLSPVALAALIVVIAKIWPRGMPIAVVACVLLTGFIVAALVDMSSSSTGALVLLVLPFWVMVATTLSAVIASTIHWYRQTRADSEQR